MGVDSGFWRGRLEAAVAFRRSLELNATAYRLVHGEADLLPSLIVDRYGDVLVLQALSQGMDRLVPTLVPILVELTGAGRALEEQAAGVPARLMAALGVTQREARALGDRLNELLRNLEATLAE